MHRWTDEDACFAAAQWASGIKQREIGAAFGYKDSSMTCQKIEQFISKYGAGLYYEYRLGGSGEIDVRKNHNKKRAALVKPAIAEFVKQRNARLS
jgi:tRNA(Phe) wybutosine-synthesizing methylase Tyw3